MNADKTSSVNFADTNIPNHKPWRVIVAGAYPNSVMTFRGALIRALLSNGGEVTVMTAMPDLNMNLEITQTGANFRSYRIDRNGLNPWADIATLLDLRRAYYDIQPHVVFAYTIKPVIWGAIAARGRNETKFFAMITGLGYAFQGIDWKRKLLWHFVVRLYRFALKRSEKVIFQNSDNRDVFVRLRIVPADKCVVVNGSGVDLKSFQFRPIPDGHVRFLLIARLLGEKGIREYVMAAEKVKAKYPTAEFTLIGPPDPSPDGIPKHEVDAWERDGIVNYLGPVRDVRPHIANCHVYVLPSYHEGMPRTVLEAMAVGRPILSTNVAGCRETVEQGVNGWLVSHADVGSLASKMTWFIENRDRLPSMGLASRRIAEEKFDVEFVNETILSVLGV